MADRKSAFPCNLREPDVAMQVLVKKLGGSPLLPWRQPSVGTPPSFMEYTILLQKMRSENEAELIESKHGKPVAPSQERKDAFGDLSHH